MKSRDPRAPRSSPSRSSVARMTPVQDQCRCACGSMLARVVREGLELKCRKCKSLVLIAHDELVRMYREQNFAPLIFAPPPPNKPQS